MISKKKLKNACLKAIDNIIYEGITDVEVFNRPFEIDYLKKDDIKNEIADVVCTAIRTAVEKKISHS